MGDRFPLVKFALFTFVCLGFTAWLVMTIGNIDPFSERTGYEAEFEDVTGLLVNDAVKVSGVTVGKVTDIELVEGGTALVTFQVRDDITFGPDSELAVRWRDVFGLRFLYVEPGGQGQVDEGHRFPIDQTSAPANLGSLLTRITPFIDALDPELQNQVLEALSTALVGREEDVRNLIAQAADLTGAIATRDEEIGRLLANSATIFDAYATREQNLQGLLDSFAEVSETLAARNDVLEEAVVTIADAQTELRRLVTRNRSDVDAIIDELDSIVSFLADNEDRFERAIETLPAGTVAYHLISRFGQFFNIRAVGFSNDENYEPGINSERGGELPPPHDGSAASGAAGLRGFFGAPLSEGTR